MSTEAPQLPHTKLIGFGPNCTGIGFAWGKLCIMTGCVWVIDGSGPGPAAATVTATWGGIEFAVGLGAKGVVSSISDILALIFFVTILLLMQV